MARKAVLLLIPAMLAALVGSQWPDIMRYLKIRQMSQGGGHPENVPAGGTIAYPQDSANGAPEGTGEFASARRGGPA